MNRSILVLSLVSVALPAGAAGGAAACSSSSSGGATGGDAGNDVVTTEGGGGEGGGGGVSFTPVLPCTDTVDSIYADPGDVSAYAKGDIIKCAKDPDLGAGDMLDASLNTLEASVDYVGKPFNSGAHVYRILYRTERGDPNNSPGYSSAIVYLPQSPRKGPTTPLPMILAAHGSRGQTGKCAPSKNDPAAIDVEGDFYHLVYPFVGFGFPVIAPDLAGYANYGGTGNPPSAYDGVNDVGKSNLDGARALRKLIPSALTDKIVITGHSQGGYTALDTLAISDAYGSGGTIAGVAVYAPIWLSQRAWAAIFVEPSVYTLSNSAAPIVSIWYHYTHGELLDGPGHGLDLFQDSKKAVVKAFVDNDCWQVSYPDLLDAGSSANDFFLASYVSTIGPAATPLASGNCKGDATCQKWLDRMTADWPHLTGNAAKVPILVWYANNDTTVTPDAMQCVFNRLASDQTNYKVCYDTNPVGHTGTPAEDNNYVVDWAAQQALGDPAPTETCTPLAPNDAGVPQLVDEGGAPIPCNGLLSNQ
jgi:alpha-beta hydrolase superfamily lysophospholipase